MQPIQEQRPLTEHFSFAEITWKIKNISVALCPSEQSIVSEEFQITGRDDTLWRLSLHIVHGEKNAKLYLNMLGPEQEFYCWKRQEPGLLINCYANILDLNGEQPLKSEREFLVNFRDNIVIETFYLSDIIDNLPHTGPDDLTIRCCILVDQGERVDFPVEIPAGLVDISSALCKLVEKPLHPDIQIFVNNKVFYLHKDMFYHMEALKRFMYEKFKHTRLLNYCEYSLASIFGYAYSGNINLIIGAPRIRVAEDIQRLNIPELDGAYPKERIPLESIVEVRDFTCVWKIEEHELIEESLNGPEFNVDGTNTRWKICMYPKGKINGNFKEKKHVFLEATLLESTRTTVLVNIEFSSLKGNDAIYSLRDYKKMTIGDKLEIPFFLRGGLHLKKCLIDKNLSLRITLWISTGDITTHIGDVIHPHPFTRSNCVSLAYFSRKMKRVLAEGRNWDLCLVSMDTPYEVHKFVLASRSPFIKSRMSNIYRQVLKLPEFKKHFFRVFLEYVYTGLYCDMEYPVECYMFELSYLFAIERLKEHCRQEINLNNLLQYFEFAIDHNLQNLREETYQYIINIGESISANPDWTAFFDRKTELAFQIISTWR